MKTIQKQRDNMGGVIHLWAIPPGDYSLSANTLTILSDSSIIEILFQEDSGSFQEEEIEGPAFKTQITAQVACDYPHTLGMIRQMERVKKYNLLFEDGNGNFKLAGTPQVPLRFEARLSTGSTTASLNHYAVSFTAKVITSRAIFVENPFV
jgi:hypothetical protein